MPEFCHASVTLNSAPMRKSALLFALLFIATSSLARPMTLDDLAAMKRIGVPKLSPDGKWIAYDASTIDLPGNVRKSAIYLMPAAGGAKRITEGTKQDEGPAWSPDGKSIAYVSNKDGGSKQVYIYDVAAGTSQKISNLPGGAGSVKWVPDGSGVVVVSDIYPDCGVDPKCIEDKTAAESKAPTKARIMTSLLFRHWNAWQAATRSHLIYVPLKGPARDLTPGMFDAPPFSIGGGDEFDISPDSKEVAFAQDQEKNPELSTNSDLFLIPLAGGEARRITTRGGADTSPTYSPDGKWIAWRSQSRAGYESDLWELWLYNRATGVTSRLAPTFDNWVNHITWAPDSKSIYVTAPLEGSVAIWEFGLDGKTTLLNRSGSSDGVQIARDGSVYFQNSTLKRPADIYVGRKQKGGTFTTTRLTTENDALLAQLTMGATESMWWTGADNARVQGHVVLPPNLDPSRKVPGILLIHGGPQGAFSDSWSYRWNPQVFAARGYAILMPNPRGSSGFGQKFVEEISGDWAGRVYVDLMNGLDAFLAAKPFVDATRLGAAGGSYGGYMVNWILGHSDRFKTLVSHAGVYNLESMYGVTEELWFPEWEFKGNPWDNPELYTKWSPHRFAKNFKTPTLVTHGELDFRVPIGEGFQLFTTLQRRGVPSKMLYFPDEGHWVLKPQNSKLWFTTVGDWFDQWLK